MWSEQMHTIHAPRFLSVLARRFCGHSRLLDGANITVVERADTIEIHIGNGVTTIVCLGWRHGEAFVIDRLTHPRFVSSAALYGLEEALTQFVGTFLRRHELITDSKKQGAA